MNGSAVGGCCLCFFVFCCFFFELGKNVCRFFFLIVVCEFCGDELLFYV